MITKGTSGSQAEVIIKLFDAAGNAVTGHVWATTDVKLRLPGGTLAFLTSAQVLRIVELGDGYYVLQLNATETSLTGHAMVVLQSGSTYLPHVEGQDVVDVTGSAGSLAEMPIALFDATTGAAITPHTWLTTEGQLRLPGGTLATLSSAQVGRISDIGDGYYVLALSGAETTATGGALFVLQSGSSYQPWAWETDLVAPTGTVVTQVTVFVAGAAPTTQPVSSPYTPDQPQYMDHVQAAIDRLAEQFKAKAA